MEDAAPVRRGEAGRRAGEHVRRVGRCEPADALDPVGERLPLDELHGEEDEPVARLAEVVDRADVRVGDPARLLRLAAEARQRRRLSAERGPHELERGGPLEPDVLGAIHLAHPAAPDQREHAVALGDDAAEHAFGRRGHVVGAEDDGREAEGYAAESRPHPGGVNMTPVSG